MNDYQNVDEYIASFPSETQEVLQKVRQIITDVIPDATERISYGIPTYTLGKNVVHFGGYSAHLGFYPGSEAIAAFKDRLTGYDTAKGTVKFYLNKPIPYDLIKEITAFSAKNT